MKKLLTLVLCLAMALTMVSFASADETVELLVWDTFTSDQMVEAIEAINAAFMEKYPNVKITRVGKDLDAMSQTLKAAFMSGEGPDVIYHEMGIGEMGDYVKAGYLMNLKDTYVEKGWDKTLMSVSSEVPSVGDFIYGVGHEIETMSLYYNSDILDELGIEVPKTVEELTAAMQKCKDAGYIALGNTLDQYWHTNMNFVGTVLYAFMSKEEISDCMNNDASWDLPSVRAAVNTIKAWVDAGFFPDHPEVYTDQTAMFSIGESVFWVTGNWSIGSIARQCDEDFNYNIVPFPASETNADGGSQVNFVGSGFMVSNLTEKKDIAIDYVDFALNTPESAKIWFEVADVIPPYTGDSGAKISDYLKLAKGYLSDPTISNVAGINMWLGGNAFEFYSHAGQNIVIGVYDADTFVAAADAATAADIATNSTKGSFSME